MTYEHSGAFVVRAPLLPFSTVAELDTGESAIAAWRAGDPGAVAAAVATDRDALAKNLHALLEDPVVREAVWLASPALDERLDAGEDLVRPLLSYVTRMSMRSTPFGLFAGCAAGEVGGPLAPLELPGRDAAKRHTRLDFGFLAAVIASLRDDPQTRQVLTYVPNSGRYRAGGRLRLAEARIDENRRVRYHRVTFEEDEALAETLRRAEGGATIAELAAALTDDEITQEEAEEYVGEMVAAQLLVPRLGPPVTGEAPVPGMVAALRPHNVTASVADALAEAQAEIDALDDAGPGVDRARYVDLADRLRKVDPDLRTDRLFQVDLGLGGPPAALPDAVMREVRRAIDVLHRIAKAPGEDELSRFREAFQTRYEDRVVPLAEVLDEEVGLGFGPGPALSAEGAPLLAGVMGRQLRGDPRWSASDSYLLKLVGRDSVELTDADIKALATEKPAPLADAVSATFVLARHGEHDFRLVLNAITGPSGARLLGRFCHVDPGIESMVRDHVEAEQALRPGAVYAEIVHLPEGRVGNILARPVLRPYEIEFLGTSGAEHTLPFDDLLVTVHGDRVVLWSKTLDREVIPRLTSAHNHVTGALAPYRFLTALQYQGVTGTLRWSWGTLENVTPFLPRVTYGRLVLSRATWQPSYDDLEDLRKAKSPADRFAATQRLRESLGLPRHVVLAAGDNELPLDLDRVGAAELLGHYAGRGLRLHELYPGHDELFATSPDGPRAHEVVVPLVRKGEPEPERVWAAPPAEESFPPGSEWLTAKLYCGPASADTVLREGVAPFVRSLGAAADGWFFIRYGDPDNHLRVRITAPPERLWGQVLPAFRHALQPLLDQAVVRRVLIDTYRREVARYGGPEEVRLAERFFGADSEFVLSVLDVAGGDEGLDLRWRLAVAGTDRILADAGLALADRRAIVKAQRDAYVREQGDTGESAKRRSGKLFRDERAALDALLDGRAESPALRAGLAALDRRSEVGREVLPRVPVRSLGSHVHMHVNRMLRAAQRTQELVVCDLLDRLYAARMARGS
ncbi:MAG TPA: lantibiotic dehydratase [Mycobacteriales bacterium]|jgi:thiopeptide-type bacteriocin biosynthesis protein